MKKTLANVLITLEITGLVGSTGAALATSFVTKGDYPTPSFAVVVRDAYSPIEKQYELPAWYLSVGSFAALAVGGLGRLRSSQKGYETKVG